MHLIQPHSLLSYCDRDSGLEVLGNVATQPAFKPWEVSDNVQRIKSDLALRDPSTVTMELLHSAAFRNTGLGNSLFVPHHHVGKISSDTVSVYIFLYVLYIGIIGKG